MDKVKFELVVGIADGYQPTSIGGKRKCTAYVFCLS
ncbi:Uncharacterized protein BWINRA5_02493 [Bacillus mycoides]|uniref:Uncharacterized protein n=1 Tax=Bacillus cereus (strain VD146) TaxID=1053236 RepID=R8N7Q3_BACCX|nr:hypothetical protein IK1_01275 [Bacillus cereus VD146]SCA99089.1 Uncharacterized protein BWINRA5_02493 [Bacillus mycoides]